MVYWLHEQPQAISGLGSGPVVSSSTVADGLAPEGAPGFRELRKSWECRLRNPQCDADITSEKMLKDWCKQTDSYWPGLFHCYGDSRIPRTNNEMERFIKEMKQLERKLSRNPHPELRFILHAAINALLAHLPSLPDETFLVSLSEQEWKTPEQRLTKQRRKLGLSHLIRRKPERFAELILEKLKQSSTETPTTKTARIAA